MGISAAPNTFCSHVVVTCDNYTVSLSWKNMMQRLVLLPATQGMHYVTLSSLAVITAYRPISILKIMHCIFTCKHTGSAFCSHHVSLSLFTILNIVQVIQPTSMKCPGHVAGSGEKRNKYRVVVWKPYGKRPLGRPNHRRENIKWILRK
jgi:hypothetical protein